MYYFKFKIEYTPPTPEEVEVKDAIVEGASGNSTITDDGSLSDQNDTLSGNSTDDSLLDGVD